MLLNLSHPTGPHKRPVPPQPPSSPAAPAWLFPALTGAAALLGGLASADAPGFYAQLQRPDWAPPASVFGPVWGVLYGLMAVAAWMVARSDHARRRLALTVFGLQLAANAAWSWIFFGLHDGALAMADLVLLGLLLAVSAGLFFRIRRAAGLLMLPVLAWVAFAGALNAWLWHANPGLLY